MLGLSIVIALIIFGFSLTQPLITIYQLWIFSSIWVVIAVLLVNGITQKQDNGEISPKRDNEEKPRRKPLGFPSQ